MWELLFTGSFNKIEFPQSHVREGAGKEIVVKKLSKEFFCPDMPYEKFLKFGPESLSEAELLAVILRTGTKNCSAVSLA